MGDIEDRQRIPKGTKGRGRALALFGTWLLFTAIAFAIGLPIVRESIRQSGVLTLLNSPTGTTQTKAKQEVKVWFYTSDRSIREFRQEQTKLGGSTYHDTFESLLAGPKLQALKEGAVSLIKPETNLLGITLSNKVLYINLSSHFLDSQDLQRAYEQLKRTGKGFSQVKDIVVLIEGERATLAGDL